MVFSAFVSQLCTSFVNCNNVTASLRSTRHFIVSTPSIILSALAIPAADVWKAADFSEKI